MGRMKKIKHEVWQDFEGKWVYTFLTPTGCDSVTFDTESEANEAKRVGELNN